MGDPQRDPVHYPDSDGKPLAENTLQYAWITMLEGNLDVLLGDRAFVAADLLWYPVEGEPRVSQAPDVMVAMGRPHGYRGSYRQWLEGGVAPQVVFEVLSPSNTLAEMERKRGFYRRFGVQEYYVLDPHRDDGAVLLRQGEHLEVVGELDGHTSAILGIRFARGEGSEGGELVVRYPDGRPFLSFEQVMARAEQEAARAEQQAARAEQEAARAEQEAARAEQEAARAEQQAARADREAARAERLAAQLRAMGIDAS